MEIKENKFSVDFLSKNRVNEMLKKKENKKVNQSRLRSKAQKLKRSNPTSKKPLVNLKP